MGLHQVGEISVDGTAAKLIGVLGSKETDEISNFLENRDYQN